MPRWINRNDKKCREENKDDKQMWLSFRVTCGCLWFSVFSIQTCSQCNLLMPLGTLPRNVCVKRLFVCVCMCVYLPAPNSKSFIPGHANQTWTFTSYRNSLKAASHWSGYKQRENHKTLDTHLTDAPTYSYKHSSVRLYFGRAGYLPLFQLAKLVGFEVMPKQQ